MWAHYCEAEKAWLSNLIGEPCNWCGCTETSGEARTGQREYPASDPANHSYQIMPKSGCGHE